VQLPSQTLLGGTTAAIAATPGVTRYYVEENFTGSTDANGCPAHSITAVVEGGVTLAVATAIYNNRGLGVLTNGLVSGSPVSGTQSQAVTDPNTGVTINIGFIQPPTYVPIYVIANAHLLAGGTTATLNAMQTAIVTYLQGLQIGESVNWSSLMAAAMSVNPNPLNPIVRVASLYLGLSASPSGTSDLSIAFYKVAQGITGDVVVNSV
jgi:uncharacterized phage protein gp47/JayE